MIITLSLIDNLFETAVNFANQQGISSDELLNDLLRNAVASYVNESNLEIGGKSEEASPRVAEMIASLERIANRQATIFPENPVEWEREIRKSRSTWEEVVGSAD